MLCAPRLNQGARNASSAGSSGMLCAHKGAMRIPSSVSVQSQPSSALRKYLHPPTDRSIVSIKNEHERKNANKTRSESPPVLSDGD